jgi:tetratricopeptide (TPR) repeat protein
MNDNFIPNCPTGSAEDALERALEKLIAGLLPNGESPVAELPDASLSGASSAYPEPDEWTRLASGEARPAEVDALLAHAAVCRGCSARLRLSLRLFSTEASPEEAAETAKLASASPDWQRQLAIRLARTPVHSQHGKTARLLLWPAAGLAATLVLSAGLTLWWQHVHTPERLLAEAYTHSRGFDLRIPGAGFAEVAPEAHRRGAAVREPSQLLDARARIEDRLHSAPGDPRWLQLEARADVLEDKYDPAIEILDRLLASEPATPSLLVDDAAAYFQRGSCSGSEADRAKALDYLRRADELAPGNSVVLFNEAVIMEDRGQAMNAVETWNRYLRFERDPRWQAEGRRRLQALEQKLNRLKTHAN